MLHEINADLKVAEATLNHWEKKFPEIARAAANTKVMCELAWADALEEIKEAIPEGGKAPTVPMMEAAATRKCARLIEAAGKAAAEAEIAKKLIGIAETKLTAIQTRAKLEMIEAGVTGLNR